MTIGTDVVKRALQQIGAYSPVMPENPESLALGKDTLNSMIARWQDEGIEMGCVPLNSIGDELSEPLGAFNGIVSNLAIELQPYFPSTKISSELRRTAYIGLNAIRRQWKPVVIPNAVARSTFPKGAGNYETFFDTGETISDA